MDIEATAIRHRPNCPQCLKPMHRAGTKKDTAKGTVAFKYWCRDCGEHSTVRLQDLDPNSIVERFGLDRISELIREVTAFEDSYQDAWLAILRDHSIQTEEDITRIVIAINKASAKETSTRQIKERSGDKLLTGGDGDEATSLFDVLPDPGAINPLDIVAPHEPEPSLKVRVNQENEENILDLSSVSRVEVARAVCCVPEHISAIFLGKTVCTMALAYDISKYLGCTLDDFYKAVTGSNGSNPGRNFRDNSRDYDPHAPRYAKERAGYGQPLIPKYSVGGQGFPNLREALRALDGEKYYPSVYSRNYNALPDDLKSRIIKNRLVKGR